MPIGWPRETAPEEKEEKEKILAVCCIVKNDEL